VDGFAEVLSMADELLLLDIYPARELPIEGVTSEIILNKMTSSSARICGMGESLDIIKANKPELLLTVGAGDIDTLVQPLKDILTNA
jgi:UDP-N-acetylmuramate--alanine ligase